jgi:hypothetical protein
MVCWLGSFELRGKLFEDEFTVSRAAALQAGLRSAGGAPEPGGGKKPPRFTVLPTLKVETVHHDAVYAEAEEPNGSSLYNPSDS